MFQHGNEAYESRVDRKFMEGGRRCEDELLELCWSGRLDRLSQLLPRYVSGNGLDAFLTTQDDFGNNALHVSSYRCRIEAVKAILDLLGLNKEDLARLVQSSNHMGNTALHLACMKDCFDIAELLLDHGADPLARDLNGRTPFHTIAEYNAICCAELFLNRKVTPAVFAYSGVQPLMIACRENHKDLALMLAKAGADICAKSTLFCDGRYQTPITEAASQGWGEVLRRTGAVPDRPRPPYVVSVSDTEIRVCWYETLGRSAPVDYYHLQIRQVDRLRHDTDWTTVDKRFKERTHTFGICKSECSTFRRLPVEADLAPNDVYEVRVSAVSIVGESPPSPPSAPIFTPSAAPCTPAAPRILRTGPCAVTVTWFLPDSNGMGIERFELQYCLCHTNMTDWVSVPDELHVEKVPSEDEISSSESDTEEEEDPLRHVKSYEHTISSLTPGHSYKFRVRALNMLGWSYFSAPSKPARTRDKKELLEREIQTNQKPQHEPNVHVKARYRQVLNLYAAEAQIRELQLNCSNTDRLLGKHKQRVNALRIQSWFRCMMATNRYNRFLKAYEKSRYFLLQYGTDKQFMQNWRQKLLFHATAHQMREKRRQKRRDEKRSRKLARRRRREQRRRKRSGQLI